MNTNATDRVGIVGGGLAGLAAAVVLAGRGRRVVLFEANDWLGGKAARLTAETSEGRFRFDMGPTILTVPRVLERVFAEAGRAMHDELDLVRLDPQWRCFFDDGAVLDLREDISAMRSELQRFGNGDGERLARGYESFIEYSKRLHRISEDFFFWKSIGSLRDMFDARTAFDVATLGDVLAMRMGRSVAGTIRRHVGDERVAQMLDHFTQYVGSSPYASPAILCSIAHMQTDEGVWYPRGGTRAVPEALERVARDLGVEVRTGVGVKRVLTEGGRRDRRVTGVELDTGERVTLDAVVSNMDSVRTMRELVRGDASAGGMAGRGDREPACSGVVLYLGLREGYKHLAHHDFVFSRDPHEEFEHIYTKGEPAPGPDVLSGCACSDGRARRGRPAGGGSALYSRSYAVSQAAPRLVAGWRAFSFLPPDDHGQAQADSGAG